MKNILKKIGLIAIILGVLSPFITLPKVNAVNEDCDYYVNQYLFIAKAYGEKIYVFEKDESASNSIGKRNYTNFLYTFPKITGGQTLNIIKTGRVNLLSNNGLNNYYEAYNLILGENTNTNREKFVTFGDWLENTNGYKNVTTIVHGRWSDDEEFGKPEEASANPFVIDEAGNVVSKEDFINNSIQKVLPSTVKIETTFGGANYNGANFGVPSNLYRNDLESFIKQVVYDYNSGITGTTSYQNNYLIAESGNEYFNTNITRSILKSDLNKLTFGFKRADGVHFLIQPKDGSNSTNYEAYKSYLDNNGGCPDNSTCKLVTVDEDDYNVDIELGQLYWWPEIFNVEYSICSNVTVEDKKIWNLTYDSGVEDASVKNIPLSQTNITTTSVTLSDKVPERKDYIFKSWCTEKDGKGSCTEAGKVFENKEMTNKTLFAYWVKPGTENNEKQGVMSYVIGFAGVGIITCGLYYLINKKNLFKQI